MKPSRDGLTRSLGEDGSPELDCVLHRGDQLGCLDTAADFRFGRRGSGDIV